MQKKAVPKDGRRARNRSSPLPQVMRILCFMKRGRKPH